MSSKTIRGKIIRIIDNTTVVINLGLNAGINNSSVFSILGQPEILVDPFTKEELGKVSIVKGRVRATSVSEKFTIASSKWTSHSYIFTQTGISLSALTGSQEVIEKEEKELRVKELDKQPWKAVSEDFVRVGDEVEVSVDIKSETSKEKPKLTLKKK